MKTVGIISSHKLKYQQRTQPFTFAMSVVVLNVFVTQRFTAARLYITVFHLSILLVSLVVFVLLLHCT